MAHSKLKRIFGGLGLVVLVLVLGYAVIRPLHLGWGATSEEVSRAMPGDLNGARWTRAITINAAPEQVWPWLLQWGQGRGGWYSYDWLENLFGFDIHTAERILPEFQKPVMGAPMCMAPNVCPMSLTVLEPARFIGWQAAGDKGESDWTFIFGLFPVDGSHTRLIVRESFDKDWLPPAAALALEIPDVVMEQKALNTVKNRVEGWPEPALVSAYEIIVWLAALGMGIIAAVLFVRRSAWKKPLTVAVAALLVLLVLTFLFPALWLRGVLDLGLLAGLVWAFRKSAPTLK